VRLHRAIDLLEIGLTHPFLIGASNKKNIQANQDIKITARIQASFSLPLVLLDAAIIIIGNSQISPINPISANTPRPKSSIDLKLVSQIISNDKVMKKLQNGNSI